MFCFSRIQPFQCCTSRETTIFSAGRNYWLWKDLFFLCLHHILSQWTLPLFPTENTNAGTDCKKAARYLQDHNIQWIALIPHIAIFCAQIITIFKIIQNVLYYYNIYILILACYSQDTWDWSGDNDQDTTKTSAGIKTSAIPVLLWPIRLAIIVISTTQSLMNCRKLLQTAVFPASRR